MTTGVNLRCSNAATSLVGNAVVFVHPVGPFMFGIVPEITFSNMMLRVFALRHAMSSAAVHGRET
jgi:hypothetical protein